MDELEQSLARVVKTYSSLGMSWADVLAIAEQLRNKKIHDILVSTLSHYSLQELSVAQEVAYKQLQPPVTVYPPPEASSTLAVTGGMGISQPIRMSRSTKKLPRNVKK